MSAALVKGCLDAERTADSTYSKKCLSDEQCSLDYTCDTKSSLCCPNQVCEAKLQEKTTDGKTKSCNENEPCSRGYQCKHGVCCPLILGKPEEKRCSRDQQELMADGQVKTCDSHVQCGDGYACLNGYCCVEGRPLPISTTPCSDPEKEADGKTVKFCSKTSPCSVNFQCKDSTCCPLNDNDDIKRNNAAGICPSEENVAVGSCFNIDDSMRCSNNQDCQGEQLCCQSGCGKICTEPDIPLTPCQRQFRMAAIQLLYKKDTCNPVYIPRCNSDGLYKRKQCLLMHGICWCVYKNGTKIEGSEVRGNPDCSKASKPGSCSDAFNWNVTLFDEGCQSDNDCSGPDKCCPNGFGHQCAVPDGMLKTERNKRSLPPGCPNGNTMKCCDIDLCLHEICPKQPTAVCRANPCDDCAIEFYDDMNRKVDSCYEAITQCEKSREDMLGDAVPSLQWIDTTNPPWLEQSSVMGTLDSLWLDTTNPPYMTATDSSSPAPQGTSATLMSAHWLDTTLLLQKVSEDDEQDDDKDLTLPETAGTRLGSFVCPVILPTTYGICQQECNKDGNCGQKKKCCFNGCSNTCQTPVQVTSTSVCKLPPVSGECISQPYVNRTFFNKDTGQCETFLYREGCEGNANNFLTVEACIRGCTNDVPDDCLVNPEPGRCEGYFPMWFYNVTSNKCEQFIYGGCDGNKNLFSSEKQCQMLCSPKLDVTDACKSLVCSDNSVCLAFNKTYAECILKTTILPEKSHYIPVCEGGLFSTEQCSGTTCWCVNPNTGTYIEDTMRIGPAPCNTSDNATLTDSHKPVCLSGSTPSPCIGACQLKSCHGYPEATCLPDPCNNCSVKFVDSNMNTVKCDNLYGGPPIAEKCTNKKPDHHSSDSHIGCYNPAMRYIYNPETKNCEGFLYTICDGPDVYFTSYYDCQDQCGNSMCPGSQPMTCDNTCLTASCAHLTGSLCQVNLCTCQPEFYDPITSQKVNCDAVFPICQLQRTNAYSQIINKRGTADRFKKLITIPVCDEHGDFVPQQCNRRGKMCWCVDGTGRVIPNSRQTTSSSIQDIHCKKNTTKTAIVSFSFTQDYDMYVKGKEEKLKRLIFDELRKLSSVFDNLVKKISISRGSIKVDVELEGSSFEENQQVASHANLLEGEIRTGFTVDMDGAMMTADRDTVDTALTFQSQTGPDKSSRLDKGTVSQKTLIIIIVVVCGVLFIVIIILIICAKRKSQRSKEADLVTVENNQRPNSLYFKNDACDFKDEPYDDKYDERCVDKDDKVDEQIKIPE